MFTIFKWFFGVVGIIILIYIIFVLLRTFFGFGLTAVTPTTTSTQVKNTVDAGANTVAYQITHFDLAHWYKSVFPVRVRPLFVIDDSYINDRNEETDFDKKWGGNSYFGNSNDNKYSMPSMLFPSDDLNTRGDSKINTKNYGEACVITGCSNQFCLSQSDAKNLTSTCEYQAAYACYQNAICERNSRTGRCGWRPDAQVQACLQNS